ncbi:MAG: C39 family peptidase [Methanophagales archaeon]|nr:C39 family peptidase [Methanophagales archaeon]
MIEVPKNLGGEKKKKMKKIWAIGIIAVLMCSVGLAIAQDQGEYMALTTNKQITLCLDKLDGILIGASENKTAQAYLIGTIDKKNHLLLSGTILINGKPHAVDFEGKAEKIFVGWNVPEGAEPIYRDLHGKTMTRYEGATRMYACTVALKDKKNQFDLKGEFFEDGIGGLVGTAVIDGMKYEIGLRGSSVGLVEEVINDPDQTMQTRGSKYLDVPQRSQWELFWDGHGYDNASRACGETCAAMLEEYWNGNHPDIWDIWLWNDGEPMNLVQTEAYFDEVSVPCWKDDYQGSLTSNINHVKTRINWEWPLDITEESQWGNCHAVVVRGYDDSTEKFVLRDPNTWTGTNTMKWYDEAANFNFEDNVYEYVGGEDEWSNGYVYVA